MRLFRRRRLIRVTNATRGTVCDPFPYYYEAVRPQLRIVRKLYRRTLFDKARLHGNRAAIITTKSVSRSLYSYGRTITRTLRDRD